MTRLLCAVAATVLAGPLAGCSEQGLGRAAQLFVVDLPGGKSTQLTDDARSYSSPSWSPDGRRLAVVVSGPEAGAIEVVDVDTPERRRLVRRRGFIQAVAWSPRGGTIAYLRLQEPAAWTLETVAADGSGGRQLAAHRSDRVPAVRVAWAPDGRSIAFNAGADTLLVRAMGEPPRLLLADAWAPRWSPNGRAILVTRREALVAVPVDGKRPATIVGGLLDAHAAWSPDSDRIAFSGVTQSGDRRYHLYLVSARDRRVRRIASKAVADAPAWSPDGRSLAFATWEAEVRVLTLATGDLRTVTRLRDAEIRDLAWSPDGRRLAFVAHRAPED